MPNNQGGRFRRRDKPRGLGTSERDADIICLQEFSPGEPLTLVLHHADGTNEEILVSHSYGSKQIEWFRAGSALNMIAAAE